MASGGANSCLPSPPTSGTGYTCSCGPGWRSISGTCNQETPLRGNLTGFPSFTNTTTNTTIPLLTDLQLRAGVGNVLSLDRDGEFEFPQPLVRGQRYTVSISQQPAVVDTAPSFSASSPSPPSSILTSEETTNDHGWVCFFLEHSETGTVLLGAKPRLPVQVRCANISRPTQPRELTVVTGSTWVWVNFSAPAEDGWVRCRKGFGSDLIRLCCGCRSRC